MLLRTFNFFANNRFVFSSHCLTVSFIFVLCFRYVHHHVKHLFLQSIIKPSLIISDSTKIITPTLVPSVILSLSAVAPILTESCSKISSLAAKNIPTPFLPANPIDSSIAPGPSLNSGIIINTPPDPSAPRVQSIISISGKSFHLPIQTSASFSHSLFLAMSFHHWFHSSPVTTSLLDSLDLTAHFLLVRKIFAPDAFESAALAFVQDFNWTDATLARDRDLLHSLGSLDLVLEHYSTRHRVAGMNPERIYRWLAKDPRLSLLLTMATSGGEVDTDPDFVPFRHSGPLRPLQQRLLPVYRYHAHKMWCAGKGLLFRLCDIPPATLAEMHTGNACHLVPKPDTPEGRFIIDASNVPAGQVPLNGESTKEQAILRYGAVILPNIRGTLTRWDAYRRLWQLQWSDLLIFKEDIKSCFNHLRWSTRSSKLLSTMVDPETVFVMLTGGFGHASTPMQWDVVGGAILTRVRSGCPEEELSAAPPCDIGPLASPVDMYVDDSFGAGRADHVTMARDRVVLVCEGVLAPSAAISTDKSVLAPATDILGYYVDCSAATIRPKDRAIDKLFYVLFSFNCADSQPLVLWQCLASLVNMYSHVVRGMRPFVAAIIHMTCRSAGHHNKRAKATAAAVFAIEMWRAAVTLLIADRACLSVPLDLYLLALGLQSLLWKVISDASPWRLAAGLYDYHTGQLICWTTLLLPYAVTDAHRFQTQRKYLGHLLSLLLIVAHKARSPTLGGTTSYQWVNDNTGAISWVNTHKSSSVSSLIACMAVSQINLLTDVWAADAIHIPGSTMGEIDAMSRLEAQSNPVTAFPTLTPSTFLSLQSPTVLSLFARCDPALTATNPAEHHTLFSDVSALIHDIIHSFVE